MSNSNADPSSTSDVSGGDLSEFPSRRRYVMFVLAAFTSFILYLHRYTWNFVRPALKEEYNFDNTELSLLQTAFNAAYSIGQIPGGIVCDLFGPHLFVGIIIALWSLALPCLGFGSSMGSLAAARALFGAAQAGCYPSLAKVTRVWFPTSKRTILQGLIASFFGRSGGAVSSIIFSTLFMGVFFLTWRQSLIAMAALGLVFAVAFLMLAKDRPEDDPQVNAAELAIIRQGETLGKAGERDVLPVGRAIRNRSLQVFVLQQFLNAGADFSYASLMGSFFMEARGVTDKVMLGVLASMPLWGGACGGIVGGFLNDGLIHLTGSRRWARTTVGFTGKALATGFLYLALTQSDPMNSAIYLFITKFFSDFTQPTVWGTSTDLGGRYSATVFSIINTSGGIGGVITPVVGGILLDRYETSAIVSGVTEITTHFEPVFILTGAMYLASAFCWLFINCENAIDADDAPVDDAPIEVS
ncbi:MAG: MFS transporter [Planctomycetota bacterium]|nr:MFS transporter [Planctomycetota bacterium]